MASKSFINYLQNLNANLSDECCYKCKYWIEHKCYMTINSPFTDCDDYCHKFEKKVDNTDRLENFMIDLEQAIINNEKSNVDFGLTFEQLRDNKQYHNKIFYDKWGIRWKYTKDKLIFHEKGYFDGGKRLNPNLWHDAYMEGCDLPYKRFFTLEQLLQVKPKLF